jgi:hypothetical protein
MPKRNLVLLCLIAIASLLAWAARDRAGRGRLYGEVTGHVGRMVLEPVDDEALFQSAMENQDRWQEFVNRSADAIDYQKRGGMQAMADAMAGTREAYAAAEKEALLGASNDVMERQFAELEGKRKALNAQLSRANKQERELIQKQIDVIETQNEGTRKT